MYPLSQASVAHPSPLGLSKQENAGNT
jgi:hypothetical protein